MHEPANYAVVDYRAFRALGAAEPQLLDPQTYPDYADFMQSFQYYNSEQEAYGFYMDVVRDIAQREGRSTREVNMALWAFNKSNT